MTQQDQIFQLNYLKKLSKNLKKNKAVVPVYFTLKIQ